MNARQELAGLLDQWLQLTQAEGAAIQAADWAKVREIQTTKARLQPAIAETKNKFSGAIPFPAQVGRLLSMETRNSELLAEQVRRVSAEKASLDQAQKNLRRIQRSYVPGTKAAAWNCYS
ncbi:MAG: hypothetical protein JWQ04_491 [Pedosphaera sp.]|nr:hypothetical protein [Pedosphaera sp.]